MGLPPERQDELLHRYVLGLYRVLETLTSRFPEVLFENCASGGARMDAGMMYYFPQTWVSDNSDAVCRLRIQYGTSLCYPPVMTTAHISASPTTRCCGRRRLISARRWPIRLIWGMSSTCAR